MIQEGLLKRLEPGLGEAPLQASGTTQGTRKSLAQNVKFSLADLGSLVFLLGGYVADRSH